MVRGPGFDLEVRRVLLDRGVMVAVQRLSSAAAEGNPLEQRVGRQPDAVAARILGRELVGALLSLYHR